MLFVFNSDAEREAWASLPAIQPVLAVSALVPYSDWAVTNGARFCLPVLGPEDSLEWIPCLHKRETRGWCAERGMATLVCLTWH
jgi:hypothetical protein